MSDAPAMTSHRPYLLRALWEWISDNGMTPHLLVDATRPGVRVPPHTIKDGKVVLNVADRAVARLEMGNEAIAFTARFGGVSHPVEVPIPAVLAIYARETGQGMALPEDMVAGDAPITGEGAPQADESRNADSRAAPRLAAVETDGDAAALSSTPDPDGPQEPPPRRGPHLRVVK